MPDVFQVTSALERSDPNELVFWVFLIHPIKQMFLKNSSGKLQTVSLAKQWQHLAIKEHDVVVVGYV